MWICVEVTMAVGELALVLHAHLPYVRSGEPGSLEEDWYYQALQECYLPLLQVLEAAAADPQQRPRLTLGLSPTLLSLLADEELNRGFLPWLQLRIELLELAPPKAGQRPSTSARTSPPWWPIGSTAKQSCCHAFGACRAWGCWI